MEDLRMILFFVFYCTFAAADILVTTPNGMIRGGQEYSERGISFYAFQGIPYAKPPVGELRFKEPQPSEKWKGILNATVNTKVCYQMTSTIQPTETEDCLYLNVYTPKIPSADLSLPVMFYIHGGGFKEGAGVMDVIGPHYFMENDVIVVTVNYRLGPLGFLSTGDTVIPGNYGLKDQQMGLKWVRDNIQFFGGDPEKVTIFGESAGGASVTYQLLSKQSEGLFRAAITASGTALNPWTSQKNHKECAYRLATAIDGNFNRNSSTEEILELLREVPAAKIKAAFMNTFKDERNSELIQGLFFSPVVEPEHETAFFTGNQYQAIENGNINKVPLMVGICSEEYLTFAKGQKDIEQYFRELDTDVTLLVSGNMHLEDKKHLKEAGAIIRNIYTNGSLQENKGAAMRYHSDTAFTRGLMRHAQLQSKFTDVYFYEFSYHGKLGHNSGPFYDGAERVGHAEDIMYLWVSGNSSTLNSYPKEDVLTSDRFRALYTNFAKYLNPTPEQSELLQNTVWPKVTPDNFQFLNFNDSLTIESNPKWETYQKWLDIYERVAVKPHDTF
ncbi:hypothetical protein JTB14_013963 [Gonioctena quinquepunctata]|nr:hypothetical protein JTB14_013963 [Gonioctena quinquepunctata]